MARYYSKKITGALLPRPPVGPLTGMQIMKGARAGAALAAQDKAVELSRRVLLRHGLSGDSDWLVPNTDPTDAAPATRTYPAPTGYRTIARWFGEVTPGSFLKMSVLAVPSGETQITDGAAGFLPGGAGGTVRATIQWTDADGNMETTNTDVSIPASTQTFAATRTAAGEAWMDLQHHESALIYPVGALTDVVALRKWTRPPVSVGIQLTHQAGARVVDACIYELPAALALEADDPEDEWASHIWDTPVIGVGPGYPYQHRIDAPDGDLRGIQQALATQDAQAARLGPALFSWSAWKETDGDPTGITEAYATTNTTPWKHMCDTNITSWSASAPGWSLSAGANARNQADNGEWVHRDGAGNTRTASVPLLVRIYSNVEAGGSGTLRLQTGLHSYMDCTVTNSGVPSFADFYGHLECGLGPEQPFVAVPLFRSNSGGKWFTISSIAVFVTRSAPAA